jgi:hypothetical protein
MVEALMPIKKVREMHAAPARMANPRLTEKGF